MKYIFWLSGEHIELAKEEVLSLLEGKDFELDGRALVLNKKINERLLKRLAFTKKACKYLFECDAVDLIKKIKDFKWNKLYKGSFSVQFENKKKLDFKEKDIASYIWHSVKSPKVDLKNPKTPIEFVFSDKKVYCGLLIYENKERFNSRTPNLRPGFHPSSMHPKLARAIVNLLGPKCKLLIDPFCGSGGFLIEAGLMGIKTIGYDIDGAMLGRSKKNLDYFKIKDYELIKKDSTTLDEGFDYIATDLPYGKNTKGRKYIEKTYDDFLKFLKNKLRKGAVVVFPHFVDYKKMIKKNNLKIYKEFSWYINKSLTRKIVLVKKAE